MNIVTYWRDTLAVTMSIIMSVQENRLLSKIPWKAWFSQHLSLDWMVSGSLSCLQRGGMILFTSEKQNYQTDIM